MTAKKKKIYLGTNTKMYKTIAQTVDFVTDLCRRTQDISRESMELFVIPSFTALEAARKSAPESLVKIGAQNMGWVAEGPYTGEISPLMLQEVGVKIVEIGHSERRHVLMETDEMENKKVLCALDHGFIPLLCIGETAAQKDRGESQAVLCTQLQKGLTSVTAQQAQTLWIAYEPVWAIGATGIPATKEYASSMHKVIRGILTDLFGAAVAQGIPLLYGGSVHNENAVGLSRAKHIDGLFIGRSAWNAENFEKIIRSVLPQDTGT